MRLDEQTPIFRSEPVRISKRTNRIELVLRRPTTVQPIDWDDQSTLKASIVVAVDGEEFRASGQVTGGIRKDQRGQEMPEYRLWYRPTIYRDGNSIRHLGERAQKYEAHVELEWLRGSIETELLSFSATEAK